MVDVLPAAPVLADYTEADNGEALALERFCTQGGALRLSFHRPTFHRRAEMFPWHRLITARRDGDLIGVVAVAIKDVELFGRADRAAFLFDLRVHPRARGRGVARALATEALDWGFRSAQIAYLYTVDENRAVRQMGRDFGGTEAGRCSYLVLPAISGETHRDVRPCPATDVRAELRRVSGPFDLIAEPIPAAVLAGPWQGSWIIRRGGRVAGCSAWSNREIFAEVVEALPLHLRLAGAVSRVAPLRQRLPHVPRAGEQLRSWYLYDAFADDEELARVLLRHVAGEARAQGIHHLYLVHTPRERWVETIRRALPRLFTPLVRYTMLARTAAGPCPSFDRLHVDIRDL
jgi:GNAT superfamily N-acetyltransferase